MHCWLRVKRRLWDEECWAGQNVGLKLKYFVEFVIVWRVPTGYPWVRLDPRPVPASRRVGYGRHPRVKNGTHARPRRVGCPAGTRYPYPNCHPYWWVVDADVGGGYWTVGGGVSATARQAQKFGTAACGRKGRGRLLFEFFTILKCEKDPNPRCKGRLIQNHNHHIPSPTSHLRTHYSYMEKCAFLSSYREKCAFLSSSFWEGSFFTLGRDLMETR
jgi:hypothetical protein